MSRDIPIIFSAPMVRALLDGRKTMTRRLAWRPTNVHLRDLDESTARFVTKNLPTWRPEFIGGSDLTFRKPTSWQSVKAGDRLWVRENFSKYDYRDGCWYWADGRVAAWDAERPRPSIHMPRWASRITLIVTATKIERLQEIGPADVLAEGHQRKVGLQGPDVEEVHRDAGRDWFSDLWISLHGVSSWAENPEVIAISFRVIKANIDAPEAMAA